MSCDKPNCCKNQPNTATNKEFDCVCEGDKSQCQCAVRTRERIRQERLERMTQQAEQ